MNVHQLTYYKYVDRLHIEPKSWEDLLEFEDYANLDKKINKAIASYNKGK